MDGDSELIRAINRRTGAGLIVRGRAEHGKLGGAIYAEWPDGRPAVVTLFDGELPAARQVAEILNLLQDRGYPVPRHELVVELGDQVVFVQQRLPQAASTGLSLARIRGIAAINERFAGALADLPDVPPVTRWFRPPGTDPYLILDLVPQHDHRARDVAEEILRITTAEASEDRLAGDDLVHVDLSAANVLFDDQERPTAVVDWNLGVYRGDRRLALVQTRFDREWFVRRADPDQVELAAAHLLDEILTDLIPPDQLRTFWAFWLLHQLPRALRRGAAAPVIDWQLALAESRLSH
ncbi:phosphotransferase [Microlunatus parietis]|uniref:Aminoglycoside phosphotransferase (APT) family kinase protein n=1 Tax=Microlunatus parietis TaxID=682979 RepID=A0A7Y9ICU4_9ACTN|nr:phosphotransferase [Microlunatus parietis]NYE74258.1 aminoglycoside phosphotransferase (APT) family kinase protein [Microlunatus parietis]